MVGFHSSVGVSFSPKQVQTPDGKSDMHSVGLHQPPTCPECNSTKAWKDGLRYNGNAVIQRWLCKDCGYRFSLSQSNKKENKHTISYQVCANEKEAKNLVEVETRQETGQREATNDVKSSLFNFAWWQKKEGYAESTITSRVKLLKILTKRNANLLDPESVKDAIARQDWCNKRKVNAADAYTAFLRMTNGTWNPPRYQVPEKLPFIPTEAEIDSLISGCGRKTSTFLLLLKETGIRSGEAHKLKWTDIDFESGTVRITPEKGSRARIFKLSNKLLSMINALKLKSNSDKPFCKHLRTQRRLFAKQRANLARKLQNPRLIQIHFHTFRHWKATTEYAKTRDILHVMNILGHKRIQNTLLYTQLVEFKNDDYTSKVAQNTKEACEFIEAGFEFVCTTPENLMVFRKRK